MFWYPASEDSSNPQAQNIYEIYMQLYHTLLRQPQSIWESCSGSFSRAKADELVVLSASYLELYRMTANGLLTKISSQPCFAIARQIVAFRLAGSSTDCVAITSDRGDLSIMIFDIASNRFEVECSDTFGKTGCRRGVPGEYLAVDPLGRAIITSAIEKQKFIYMISRDSQTRIVISSGLEAHFPDSLVYCIVSVDVGYGNPCFASIESICLTNSPPRRSLCLYEVDLGTNRVLRTVSSDDMRNAYYLISVPSKSGISGGLIICYDAFLIYRKISGREDLRCEFPLRERSSVSFPTIFRHILLEDSDPTFLLQSDEGDLFKVSVSTGSDRIIRLSISYYDTLPVATSMCMMRNGLLFCAHENDDHSLYVLNDTEDQSVTQSDRYSFRESIFFCPRILQRVTVQQSIPSIAPIRGFISTTTERSSVKGLAISGNIGSSSLHRIDFSVAVIDLAVTDLPGRPSGAWCIRAGTFDKYIILAFADSTLVLSVGEEVTEVTDSNFLTNIRTIYASSFSDESTVQVSESKVIHSTKAGVSTEWCPTTGIITLATSNYRSVIVALTSGVVTLLHLDDNGYLVEGASKSFGGLTINSISITKFSFGKCSLCAVTLSDLSCRILSADFSSSVKQNSAKGLDALSTSCCFRESEFGLELFIGTVSGMISVFEVDLSTGFIGHVRKRKLGNRPVLVSSIELEGLQCMIAISDEVYLYSNPLSCVTSILRFSEQRSFDLIIPFKSDQSSNGFLSLFETSMAISYIDLQRTQCSDGKIPLRYTGKSFCILPHVEGNGDSTVVAVLQSDYLLDHDNSQKHWLGCISIIDSSTTETIDTLELNEDEVPLCMSVCRFEQLKDARPCLLVCTATVRNLYSRETSAASIKTFIYDSQFHLQLVHNTHLETGLTPLKVSAFDSKVLISFKGESAVLRLYDLGRTQLLKKAEFTSAEHSGFTWIETVGDRIFLGDISRSMLVLSFRPNHGTFSVVASDSISRWITCGIILDKDTVLAADKFENIFVLQIPRDGSSHLKNMAQFHIGEVVTSFSRLKLGSEAIIVSTLQGSFRLITPFADSKMADIMQSLEERIIDSHGVGKDQPSYRSYYLCKKSVVDGEICEFFDKLPPLIKSHICDNLQRSSAEITMLIESSRGLENL